MDFVDKILSGDNEKRPELYEALGCDRTSTTEQITAEYRARVKFLHPDKLLDEIDQQKKDEYLQLQNAYATLGDPEQRKCYDAWLECLLPLSYEEFKRNRDAVKVMRSLKDVEKRLRRVLLAGKMADMSQRLTYGRLILRSFMNAYSLDGLVVVALLVICSCAYLRRVPRIHSWLLSEKKGFFGIFYKASVIGVRLHSIVSVACFLAAGYTLFLR